MKVLLIEDEDTKLAPILSFLKSKFPFMVIQIARSVKSGIEALTSEQPELLLLDMSLPTFDISASEPGGRPQGSGGLEIMRYIDMMEMSTPIIVITAYEAFSRKGGRQVDLSLLSEELLEDFPETFKGIVYFNPMFGDWTKDLEILLNTVLQRRTT